MKKQIILFIFVLLFASLACNAVSGTSGTQAVPPTEPTQEVVLPPADTEIPVEPPVFPTIEIQVPSVDILYSDDFSNIDSGWPQDRTGNGVADYEDGGYRILVDKDNTYYWSHPDQFFSNDLRVEADAAVLGGPELNEFGIICRHLDEQNYYYFTISSQGHVVIGGLINDEYTTLAEDDVTFVLPGNATNHLAADCVGSTLTFYVNDQQALTTSDSSIIAGDVGLIAGTYDEVNVDIMFDNLVVFAK
jgi:hypothetical protein